MDEEGKLRLHEVLLKSNIVCKKGCVGKPAQPFLFFDLTRIPHEELYQF